MLRKPSKCLFKWWGLEGFIKAAPSVKNLIYLPHVAWLSSKGLINENEIWEGTQAGREQWVFPRLSPTMGTLPGKQAEKEASF